MMRRVHVAAGVALVLLGIGAAPAAATTFVVNSTADPATPDNVCSPTPGGCTLRDALDDAGPAETVSVPGGTYQLTQGPLRPSGESIVGAGARSTIINGGGVGSVFVVITAGNRLSGVTLTNGGGQNQEFAGGGGILLTSSFAPASITVVNTTISGNAGVFGAGIANIGGTLSLIGSTVSGNVAFSNSVGTAGGGIGIEGNSTTRITNSTISGNLANSNETTAGGGGLYFNVSSTTTLSLTIENSTIANNRAETGAGLLMAGTTGTSVTVSHTIVAGNLLVTGAAGSSCNLDLLSITADHDIADDASCDFAGTPRDPRIGPLANNGGQTNTHALAITSPAINAGTSCLSTDQRGIRRDGACDIGAFEYFRPRLTIIKQVVNDQGGTQSPGDFNVHVRAGAADVSGSPQPGIASGRTYTLSPGTYTVGEDADDRYVASISGACAANGTVTLAESQVKTCTIINNDKPPVVGKLVNAEPEGGIVRIKLPRRKKFRRLTEGEQLPVGTIVDTLKGRIALTAAANKKGGLAKADFYDGIFKLGQTKGKKPITTLTLVETLTGCKAEGNASAAATKKKKRRLWGDGKGRFRTKGKHSAATVVGTKWLVEDRCTSTLTRVVRGKVKVQDFAKHKTVLVRSGKRYIARAKG